MPPSSYATATATATMNSEVREAAIKQARRFLRGNVRNDWSFEPETLQAQPPPRPETQEAQEWRQRDYDSSPSELEEEEESRAAAATPVMVEGITVQNHPPGPDTDSDIAEAEKGLSSTERKMKWRRDMEEEMKWNEGLRVWAARRDAWAGARRRGDVERSDEKLSQEVKGKGKEKEQEQEGERRSLSSPSPQQDDQSREDKEDDMPESELKPGNTTTFPSSTSTDPLATKAESHLSISEKERGLEKEGKQSTDTTITEPEPSFSSLSTPVAKTTKTTTTQVSPNPDDALLPVAPPLISFDNPIRSSINASLYPSIYSKIVVQGLTPTVPINLSDMTKALVQGWKADGQWPPQATPALASNNVLISQRDRGDLDRTDNPRGVVNSTAATTRKKKKKNHHHMSPVDTAAAAGPAGNDPPTSPETKKKSSVASAVKKVFHFPGFHHRRNPNSQDSSGVDPHEGDPSAGAPIFEENVRHR